MGLAGGRIGPQMCAGVVDNGGCARLGQWYDGARDCVVQSALRLANLLSTKMTFPASSTHAAPRRDCVHGKTKGWQWLISLTRSFLALALWRSFCRCCRMARTSTLALCALVALLCLTVVSGQFFVNLNDKNKVKMCLRLRKVVALCCTVFGKGSACFDQML